jgi:hypothetical protein
MILGPSNSVPLCGLHPGRFYCFGVIETKHAMPAQLSVHVCASSVHNIIVLICWSIKHADAAAMCSYNFGARWQMITDRHPAWLLPWHSNVKGQLGRETPAYLGTLCPLGIL